MSFFRIGNKIWLIIIVACVSIFIQLNFDFIHNYFRKTLWEKNLKNVYSIDQLEMYNGINKNQIYIALLGSIFDVTKGRTHYEKGSPYNYFVGRDGSRAFVTGNFRDYSNEKDLVIDLSCNELLSLLDWRKTLKRKYKSVGFLIGRYYNELGKETNHMKALKDKIKECNNERQQLKLDEAKFPPCNVEWDVSTGSRVWCTNTSGGITRSWTGVPRQMFTPGEETPKCVCIKKANTEAMFKPYPNCPLDAVSCSVSS